MEQKFENIKDLTKKIFDNSINVSSFTVRQIGLKFVIRIYNSKKMIVFGMEGNYKNVSHICKLILNEQKINGGKLYEQQQK